jgi:hypothetical protein
MTDLFTFSFKPTGFQKTATFALASDGSPRMRFQRGATHEWSLMLSDTDLTNEVVAYGTQTKAACDVLANW